MRTSSTRQLGPSEATPCKNSGAEAKVFPRRPTERTSRSKPLRTEACVIDNEHDGLGFPWSPPRSRLQAPLSLPEGHRADGKRPGASQAREITQRLPRFDNKLLCG